LRWILPGEELPSPLEAMACARTQYTSTATIERKRWEMRKAGRGRVKLAGGGGGAKRGYGGNWGGVLPPIEGRS
jgi:hypothetical protein